jgi:hypothetical protein
MDTASSNLLGMFDRDYKPAMSCCALDTHCSRLITVISVDNGEVLNVITTQSPDTPLQLRVRYAEVVSQRTQQPHTQEQVVAMLNCSEQEASVQQAYSNIFQCISLLLAAALLAQSM